MANGDIALTSARSVPNLILLDFHINFLPSPFIQIVFAEAGASGTTHAVRITNTAAVGFDYTAGVFTDSVQRVISNEMTTMLGILFGAGANTPAQRKTAGVQRCITSGVITIAGTVG